MNWYTRVSQDISVIPDFLSHYENELNSAKQDVKIYGNVEKNIANLPGTPQQSAWFVRHQRWIEAAEENKVHHSGKILAPPNRAPDELGPCPTSPPTESPHDHPEERHPAPQLESAAGQGLRHHQPR